MSDPADYMNLSAYQCQCGQGFDDRASIYAHTNTSSHEALVLACVFCYESRICRRIFEPDGSWSGAAVCAGCEDRS